MQADDLKIDSPVTTLPVENSDSVSPKEVSWKGRIISKAKEIGEYAIPEAKQIGKYVISGVFAGLFCGSVSHFGEINQLLAGDLNRLDSYFLIKDLAHSAFAGGAIVNGIIMGGTILAATMSTGARIAGRIVEIPLDKELKKLNANIAVKLMASLGVVILMGAAETRFHSLSLLFFNSEYAMRNFK